MDSEGQQKCLELLKKQHKDLKEILKGYRTDKDITSKFVTWFHITLTVLEKCYSVDDRRLKAFKEGKWDEFSDVEIAGIMDGILQAYILEIEQGLTKHTAIILSDEVITSKLSKDVFIVHGHNEEIVEEVDHFVKSLGFRTRILKIEPDRGATIIEKLERVSTEVGYAIVILSGDDLGGKSVCWGDESLEQIISRLDDVISQKIKLGAFIADEKILVEQTLKRAASVIKELRPRARQNAIFELGYFFAYLGRERVCALYEPGVEMPTDISGFIYKPLDSGEKWKYELEKELRDWASRTKS
jgi:predicted nucleotide-binding protein